VSEGPRAIYESWLVTIYDPRDISTNFHLLELVFVWGFFVTLRHALRERTQGRPYGLMLWLTALFYGVFMELLTYNTIDNFAHGQFTVQFYHQKLPIYVVLLYPTFVYIAIQAAKRLNMGAVGSFFTAGALAVMIDVPFDIMGPDDRWWWWYEGAEDPMNLLAARWLGVPVTSYCWHLLFEGSQQWVTERFAGRVDRNHPPERGLLSSLVGLVPLTIFTGALSVVVGVIVMMPFHGFRALASRTIFSRSPCSQCRLWRSRRRKSAPIGDRRTGICSDGSSGGTRFTSCSPRGCGPRAGSSTSSTSSRCTWPWPRPRWACTPGSITAV